MRVAMTILICGLLAALPSSGLCQKKPKELGRGYSLAEAAGKMTVADGLTMTLCAGEPDVVQPIACCTDDRGRLWVAENLDYPIRRDRMPANNRILIFEDTKGTGVFDKRTVFCEDAGYVSGLQVGFGGVWVGAAPHLKFIPMRDGDDKPAGEPQILLDGWSKGGWHMLNNLTWGPDGWLYGCQGIAAGSSVGKPGAKPDERIRFDSGVWRYHPIRHEFELFAWGLSNPWGIDFDPHGQMLLTCCIIPPVWHVVQGGRYHHQSEILFDSNTYDHLKTIYWKPAKGEPNPPGWKPRPGGAPGGAVLYQGGSFPEKYRGKLFSCSVHNHSVLIDRIERKGSTFVATHESSPVLANDIQFMGFHVQPAADGSLYILDWHDTFTFNCHGGSPDDRSNGRIYKLSAAGAKSEPVDLARLGNLELARLQTHANEWIARHARRILQERAARGTLDPDPTPALEAMLRDDADIGRKLRTLWSLHAIGRLDAKRLVELLEHPNEYVRAWAIQLVLEARSAPPEALARFEELARTDPSPVVRLYLASALQRLPAGEVRWKIGAALARRIEDASDPNIPFMIWWGIEPLVPAKVERAVSLAQEAVVPFVAESIARRVASADRADVLVAAVERSKHEATAIRILRGMNEALKGRRNLTAPMGWDAAKQKLSSSSSAELTALVRSLSARFGDAASQDLLREIASDKKERPAVRRQAVDDLATIKPADLTTFLHSLLNDNDVRGPVLRGLAAANDSTTPDRLLGSFPRFSPQEKVEALAILASRPDSAKRLINAIAAGKVARSEVSGHTVQLLGALNRPEIDTWIKDNWGTTRQSPEQKKQEMAQWRARILSAKDADVDPLRGRAVFAKACAQCHRLFDDGGKVGPDLTNSARAQIDYLLHNIIDPNAEVPKNYQAWVVETSSGRVVTGLVLGRTDDAVTLATGTETVTIPAKDVESIRSTDRSFMPEGLLNNLSPQEALDLFAYLRK